jgi:hypothetical protein
VTKTLPNTSKPETANLATLNIHPLEVQARKRARNDDKKMKERGSPSSASTPQLTGSSRTGCARGHPALEQGSDFKIWAGVAGAAAAACRAGPRQPWAMNWLCTYVLGCQFVVNNFI